LLYYLPGDELKVEYKRKDKREGSEKESIEMWSLAEQCLPFLTGT
jgi:hypothetical protein